MVDISWILLHAFLIVAPSGNTKFSVAPDACRADYCDGRTYSSFYGGYVHRETPEEGEARYLGIVDAMIVAAQTELCIDPSGAKIANCAPNPKAKGWTVSELLQKASGIAIAESGLREDVEVGRGRAAKKTAPNPDDAGGQGRGPNGEACLMQIIPGAIVQFAPDGDRTPESLLGSDPEPLVRCFRTGMRMLIQARSYCDWTMASVVKANPAYQYDRTYGMFSLYGTGYSCMSMHGTKTSIRVALANRMGAEMKRQRALALKPLAAR